jgi:hypothetical protein
LPVMRALKGHACLALNRNNEALELFASIAGKNDASEWLAWAERFAHEHPDSAIAWYCQGDSHSRLAEWEDAERAFAKAVELDSQCYLAWNARGIVAYAVGNSITARGFFLKAVEIKGDFADAYSNRGILNVHLNAVRQTSGGAADETLEKAKSLSTDKVPVLPAVGLGCLYYARGEHVQAAKYFASVPPTSILAPLARENALANDIAALSRLVRKADRLGISLKTSELQPSGDGMVRPRADGDGSVGWASGNGKAWLVPGKKYIRLVVPRQGGGPTVIYVDPITGRPIADPEGVDKPRIEPGEKPDGKPGVQSPPQKVLVGGATTGPSAIILPDVTPEDAVKSAQDQNTGPKRQRPESDEILDIRDQIEACLRGPVKCSEEELRALRERLAELYRKSRGYPPDPSVALNPLEPLAIGLPPLETSEFDALTRSAEATAAQWSQQLSASGAGDFTVSPSEASADSAAQEQPPGGVDGNVEGVLANRGQWAVVSVFGLLYPTGNLR